MRSFRAYEGAKREPSYEVKAMMLHEARAAIAKEIEAKNGKSYTWRSVAQIEYYDIMIRDSGTQAVYYRLDPNPK